MFLETDALLSGHIVLEVSNNKLWSLVIKHRLGSLLRESLLMTDGDFEELGRWILTLQPLLSLLKVQHVDNVRQYPRHTQQKPAL